MHAQSKVASQVKLPCRTQLSNCSHTIVAPQTHHTAFERSACDFVSINYADITFCAHFSLFHDVPLMNFKCE